MSCYVCLKNTRYKSPCVCEAPIHKKCLVRMQKKMQLDCCTLCLEPFSGDDGSVKTIWFLLAVVFYLLLTRVDPI
jgi:hypothetical protein